ncbi:unnamed protein product [Leptidea sinapis]|uniref:Uncharacterized protein n=1 Tax=Leptidea sinapis TaxID=189913 RepID=A0A5E4QFJ4_9NEOP|nr:unnamed protein product [Leptidea sinapis]
MRGVRHGDATECGHKEAVASLPERDACQASLPGVQADEAGEPQEYHRPSKCIHATEESGRVPGRLPGDGADGREPVPGYPDGSGP